MIKKNRGAKEGKMMNLDNIRNDKLPIKRDRPGGRARILLIPHQITRRKTCIGIRRLESAFSASRAATACVQCPPTYPSRTMTRFVRSAPSWNVLSCDIRSPLANEDENEGGKTFTETASSCQPIRESLWDNFFLLKIITSCSSRCRALFYNSVNRKSSTARLIMIRINQFRTFLFCQPRGEMLVIGLLLVFFGVSYGYVGCRSQLVARFFQFLF